MFAMKSLVYITLLYIFCVAFVSEAFETSTVTTDVGTFIGYVKRVEALGIKFFSRRFLGIPYAEPPVGHFRFQKPQRKEPLKSPLEVTQYAPVCIQHPASFGGSRNADAFSRLKQSEDCLYLNIYTPYETKESNKLPVIIFIHGGAYVAGTPNIYPGDVLSTYGKVIVVTIAYRLSIFGFMSTGDDNLPGNYGLFDQQMAIKWVHDNIEAFGGDPELVTLIGHSAGSSSVMIQSMNPSNKGLFKRSLLMSGSLTCFWGWNHNPLPATKRLGQLIGCDGQGTKQLAECLRTQSSETFLSALSAKENGFLYLPFDFIATVDGDFIPETPMKLMYGDSQVAQEYQETIADIDLMAGLVSNDGLVMITELNGIEDPSAYETNRKEFEEDLVPTITSRMFKQDVPDLVNQLVIGEYTNWDNPDNTSNARDSLVKLSGDYGFNIAAVEVARMHAVKSNKHTYMYRYNALTRQGLLPSPDWTSTPQHGDELYTMFGADFEDYVQFTTPYPHRPADPKDIELTKAHITLLSNFAYSGNPNEPVDVKPYLDTDWPTYDEKTQRYLTIDYNMSDKSVGSMLLSREYNFWKSILPNVIDALENTDHHYGQNEYCEKDCN